MNAVLTLEEQLRAACSRAEAAEAEVMRLRAIAASYETDLRRITAPPDADASSRSSSPSLAPDAPAPARALRAARILARGAAMLGGPSVQAARTVAEELRQWAEIVDAAPHAIEFTPLFAVRKLVMMSERMRLIADELGMVRR